MRLYILFIPLAFLFCFCRTKREAGFLNNKTINVNIVNLGFSDSTMIGVQSAKTNDGYYLNIEDKLYFATGNGENCDEIIINNSNYNYIYPSLLKIFKQFNNTDTILFGKYNGKDYLVSKLYNTNGKVFVEVNPIIFTVNRKKKTQQDFKPFVLQK